MARGLSSCGSRAQLLHGTWGLLGPGLKPVSPALAGGFLTTAPPGKPKNVYMVSNDHGTLEGSYYLHFRVEEIEDQ